MENNSEIFNKVASSGIISIDLEELYPQGERMLFDLKDFLYEGLILREKDFREQLKSHDWSRYSGKFIAVDCTADAIIPTWAYMLIATRLEPVAKKIVFGTLAQLEDVLFKEVIDALPLTDYTDQRVVIKGCSKVPVPVSAYVNITTRLRPIAKSIMFGEPCSTVPVYKKAAAKDQA